MRFLIIIILLTTFLSFQTEAQEQRSADAWYQEGLRLCRSITPDLAKALAAYNNALRLNPQHSASAYKWRSWVKRQMGDIKGAIEDIGTAITVQPHEAKFYAIRADIRKQTGDITGAIYDYGLALQLAETSSDTAIYQALRDTCLIEQERDSLASRTERSKKNR